MRRLISILIVSTIGFISSRCFADGLDVIDTQAPIVLGLVGIVGLIGGLIYYARVRTLIAFLQGVAITAGVIFVLGLILALYGEFLDSKSDNSSRSQEPKQELDAEDLLSDNARDDGFGFKEVTGGSAVGTFAQVDLDSV